MHLKQLSRNAVIKYDLGRTQITFGIIFSSDVLTNQQQYKNVTAVSGSALSMFV